MNLRVSAFLERLRASLFFVPVIGVVAAIAAAAAALSADRWVTRRSGDLPLSLLSTVDGARTLLSTIAGATISFAGIAFSVSLLVIQQASSQHSPRVVHALFRDPFNKRIMGLVVGTFTYCLIVLRSVRGPLDEGGQPVVPNLSVAIAVVLGIATILAIVAFIDHSAHSMDVSEILENVRSNACAHVKAEWRVPGDGAPTLPAIGAAAGAAPIRFTSTGWCQQIDVQALLAATPEGSNLVVEAYPGRYAIAGTVLASIWPVPDDLDPLTEQVNAAVSIGDTRTMQQDASYGLRQLADVALKALSPGVNDPTTAQDAIFHSAAVLAELLQHDPPIPSVVVDGGRRVEVAQQPTPEDLVALAFAETRQAAASQPTVCIYLFEAMHLVRQPLVAAGLDDRVVPVEAQAALTLAGCRAADLLPEDLAGVEAAYEKRFGPAKRADA